jgi:hypothetical protein
VTLRVPANPATDQRRSVMPINFMRGGCDMELKDFINETLTQIMQRKKCCNIAHHELLIIGILWQYAASAKLVYHY